MDNSLPSHALYGASLLRENRLWVERSFERLFREAAYRDEPHAEPWVPTSAGHARVLRRLANEGMALDHYDEQLQWLGEEP